MDEKHAFHKAQKAQFQAPINQNFGNMKAQNPVQNMSHCTINEVSY